MELSLTYYVSNLHVKWRMDGNVKMHTVSSYHAKLRMDGIVTDVYCKDITR